MAERVRAGYRRLFEIRVLHHYWLDEGATLFQDIETQAQTRRLLRYDARQFVAISPSPTTAATLAGLRGICRTTGLGVVVAVPDDALITAGSAFDFVLTPASGELTNYTAMTLRPRAVVQVVDPASGRTLRYKEGTPVLSNLTGAARTWGGHKHLFLSSDYPAGAGERIEEMVAAGSQLRQLTSDQPAATFSELGQIADLPVFLHQGDAPVVLPPPGVLGAPARGIELTPGTPEDVLAVIRLSPRRVDDDDFSFVDVSGHPRATAAPVFEVHLKNRSTTWRYRKKGDGSVISTEPEPLGLTYFGNAGTQRKPTTSQVGVELDPASPARVVQLVSEIFV